MFNTLKPLEWIFFAFCFFFFLSNVHHSLSKLERILTLMIFIKNELKKFKIKFTTHLSIFGSNLFLALKLINFEDVNLTKVIYFYVGKNIIT